MRKNSLVEKPESPCLDADLRSLLGRRVVLARDGFMSQCVDAVPKGCRPHLVCDLLPVPLVAESQWDHADCTSRALRAWCCVREITGASTTGRAVEAGLWAYLQSVINPETGLACVPEYSNRPEGPCYYHTWDQGRLFDYLVLRWAEIAQTSDEKAEMLARIRRLQGGLTALSAVTEQSDGTVARWWPAEVYYDTQPQPETGSRGPHDFRGWCIGGSQFLPPQVRLAVLTGEPADLNLALEMARGFLAGYEHRRGSTAPMFAADGRFHGHFHGAVSGLDGVVQLACHLYHLGETVLATEWIELAVRVYRWIFDSARNVNPGSACGCFPETARDEPHMTSELCCTADMIEFAMHLAECAALHPRWAALADLWDDAECFLRNEVFKTQMTDVGRLAALAVRPPAMTPGEALATLRRQDGIWIFGRQFLHDLLKMQRPETLSSVPWLVQDAAGKAGDARLVPVLSSGGCCAYSGVRALHAVWRHAACTGAPAAVEMRIPISFDDGILGVTPLPEETGLRIRSCGSRRLRLRIPRHVERVAVDARDTAAVWSGDRRWLTLDLAAGSEAAVTWQPRDWAAVETFGPLNADGVVPGVAPNERVRCTLHYRGAEVVRVEPENAAMPFARGL